MLKSFDTAELVPTWAAYNSLITDLKPQTIVSTLPIISGSPTEWENLYTAIMEAEKLRKYLNRATKTIISFDLQLYSKAIQLQQREDIQNNFVFRLGELHVVFCFIKTLGKMISGSSLDQAFIEAGKVLLLYFFNCFAASTNLILVLLLF